MSTQSPIMEISCPIQSKAKFLCFNAGNITSRFLCAWPRYLTFVGKVTIRVDINIRAPLSAWSSSIHLSPRHILCTLAPSSGISVPSHQSTEYQYQIQRHTHHTSQSQYLSDPFLHSLILFLTSFTISLPMHAYSSLLPQWHVPHRHVGTARIRNISPHR